MARLHVKTDGLKLRSLELRLGANRVGRDPDADFTLPHPSVSFTHCEFILSHDGVLLRDCGSTNGTFVDNEMVKSARLQPGQAVRLGEVELAVESTDVTIAIPKIEREIPRPPVVLPDGGLLCPRHPENQAAFRCPHCREIMCQDCVRMTRIKGGRPLFLCCACHQKCERIGGEKPKAKKGLLGRLEETVRLKFGYGRPKK